MANNANYVTRKECKTLQMRFVRFIKKCIYDSKKLQNCRNLLKSCRIAHKPNKNQQCSKHKRTKVVHFTLIPVNVRYQEIILPNRCCGL